MGLHTHKHLINVTTFMHIVSTIHIYTQEYTNIHAKYNKNPTYSHMHFENHIQLHIYTHFYPNTHIHLKKPIIAHGHTWSSNY